MLADGLMVGNKDELCVVSDVEAQTGCLPIAYISTAWLITGFIKATPPHG